MAAIVQRLFLPGGFICAGQCLLKRTIAGLVFATLVATGTASASSFVTPEPMTAKLGPSMVFLGAPADAAAADDPAKVPSTVANALDITPLDYPFPGRKAPPVVQIPDRQTPDKIAGLTPLNYPAPIAPAVAAGAADADFVRISPSIIAMAEPEPAVSFEQVAAVDKDSTGEESEEAARHDLFGPLPTVIRGGVVDDGSGAQFSAPAAPEKPMARNHAPAASRPGSASSQVPSSPAASEPALPPKQPDVPIPSPTPAPPPANIIPETKIQ
jgi:hypothetical protein